MEIIQIEDADLQAIEGKRRRIFQAISEPLTAEVIKTGINNHNHKRVSSSVIPFLRLRDYIEICNS